MIIFGRFTVAAVIALLAGQVGAAVLKGGNYIGTVFVIVIASFAISRILPAKEDW